MSYEKLGHGACQHLPSYCLTCMMVIAALSIWPLALLWELWGIRKVSPPYAGRLWVFVSEWVQGGGQQVGSII